ncbi:MAG: hypothetical protein AB7O81_24900 [Blastocatellales bacterium]
MFCPSCGFEYTQKTNYCKRCGEDLGLPGATDAPRKSQPNVTGMFWGVIAFCLSAMTLFMLAYLHFSSRGRCNGLCGDDRGMLSFIALFLSVVTLLLIWQLSRMITAFRRPGQEKIVEKHFIREAPPVQSVAPTGQILEAPKAIDLPSVVEHTTRQMAGVYSEPKAMN